MCRRQPALPPSRPARERLGPRCSKAPKCLQKGMGCADGCILPWTAVRLWREWVRPSCADGGLPATALDEESKLEKSSGGHWAGPVEGAGESQSQGRGFEPRVALEPWSDLIYIKKPKPSLY